MGRRRKTGCFGWFQRKFAENRVTPDEEQDSSFSHKSRPASAEVRRQLYQEGLKGDISPNGVAFHVPVELFQVGSVPSRLLQRPEMKRPCTLDEKIELAEKIRQEKLREKGIPAKRSNEKKAELEANRKAEEEEKRQKYEENMKKIEERRKNLRELAANTKRSVTKNKPVKMAG